MIEVTKAISKPAAKCLPMLDNEFFDGYMYTWCGPERITDCRLWRLGSPGIREYS
jgi:hypothetical protein